MPVCHLCGYAVVSREADVDFRRRLHFFLDSPLTARVFAVGDAGYRGTQTGRAARCGPRPDRAIETDVRTGNDAYRRSQTVVKQGLTMDP